ncbi:MAG: cobalt ECF transporter T component CbiQ [Coriobacteriia bacterium]|nr:cobalt ECF transporter T component CbiQ [Coriobacteriia bacterium]
MADHHHDEGFHQHAHEHAGAPPHKHPHHHVTDPAAVAHHHAHTTSFEALTYTVSPLHSLDARAKIVAALVLVLGVVGTPPLRLAEFALFCTLLLAASTIGRLPLPRLLARSLAVLPVAATIALLAPLQSSGGSWNATGFAAAWSGEGWVVAWSILSKAWLSACCMLLLAATTRTADLLAGLRRLKVPGVFVMLLAFIARYVGVLADQLHSLRTAVASRAPHLRGRELTRALGSIAGNLFVRSYERGERIYAAMLSRGYDGALPVTGATRVGTAEVLLVTTAMLTAAAIALY